MADRRRLNLAIGATVAFAIVCVMDVVRWTSTHRQVDMLAAGSFALLTLLWAGICLRWSRQL
ncbi:MAG TPA: hypothetical protein VMD07_02470 [Candidatus Acidoferrales bacterium]|nr:hypothetical protein [Candidatus Acidoferrales bacterium]